MRTNCTLKQLMKQIVNVNIKKELRKYSWIHVLRGTLRDFSVQCPLKWFIILIYCWNFHFTFCKHYEVTKNSYIPISPQNNHKNRHLDYFFYSIIWFGKSRGMPHPPPSSLPLTPLAIIRKLPWMVYLLWFLKSW